LSSDLFYDFVKLRRNIGNKLNSSKDMNYFFICLDSCRYDVFKEAKTPNMDEIGETQLAHSFACFTPSTIFGYLMNFPPIGLNMGRLYPYRKWGWLPKELREHGYKNAIYSDNMVLPLIDLNFNGEMLKYFDEKQFLKYENNTNINEIIKDAINFFQQNSPTFIFLLIMESHTMESHTPMFDGKKSKIPYPIQRPSSMFSFQRRSVEFIDSELKILFDAIRESERKTDVIITSDHGELMNPIKWGHNPADLTFYNTSRIYYSDELFKIPFIRGKIN